MNAQSEEKNEKRKKRAAKEDKERSHHCVCFEKAPAVESSLYSAAFVFFCALIRERQCLVCEVIGREKGNNVCTEGDKGRREEKRHDERR